MRHNLPTDKTSLQNIAIAHPKVRTELLNIYQEGVEVLSSGRSTLRLPFTHRSFEKQSQLYALGRTVRNPDGYHPTKKPMGNIVTNAKAGQSIHNFALAADMCLLIDKDGNGTWDIASWDMNIDLDNDLKKDWMEVVQVFLKYGWEWGGNWKKFKDYPHFQKTFGLTYQQLLARVQAGKVDKEGYVII